METIGGFPETRSICSCVVDVRLPFDTITTKTYVSFSRMFRVEKVSEPPVNATKPYENEINKLMMINTQINEDK